MTRDRIPLESTVREVLESEIADLRQIEVDAFLSTLINSFGLVAAHRAMEASSGGYTTNPDVFESTDGFNFRDLPRSDLVRELSASTGFQRDVCDSALKAVEDEILHSLQETGSLDIEDFGHFSLSNSHRMKLLLDDRLRVSPDTAQTPESPVSPQEL